MDARTVLPAPRMRLAKSIQLIGSCIFFSAKLYAAPDGTPSALPAVLPEALRVVVAALLCALSVLIAAFPCTAQLTIVNPKQLEVPQAKANILLNTACRVVAKKFRVSDPSSLRFSLVLVLGEREEHYTVDEKKLEYKLYMREWDETKFVALAMRFCVQRLPTREQEARLLKEILHRSDKISPVPANELRRDAAASLLPPPRNTGSDCLSAAREQPCRNPNSAPP